MFIIIYCLLFLEVFFSVVTGSITIGQIGPNLQAITTSRAASYSLFEIIDRVRRCDKLYIRGYIFYQLLLIFKFTIVNVEYKGSYA